MRPDEWYQFPYVISFRDLGNGRAISVVPLMFNRARVHIGRVDGLTFDDGW